VLVGANKVNGPTERFASNPAVVILKEGWNKLTPRSMTVARMADGSKTPSIMCTTLLPPRTP
jgi:hypothetical protein